MEKKRTPAKTEIVKWIVLLATIISAFYANRYTNQRNRERIEILEEKVKQLELCQSETALQVAAMNSLLIEMNKNVTVIKDNIINRGLNAGK